MAQNSYQLLDLSSDIILDWSTSYGSPPIIADINDIKPTANGYYIALPNASLVAVGQTFIFNNVSNFSFKLVAYDLTTEIVPLVAAGAIIELYLINTSSVNGEWRAIPYGSGHSSITNITAESTDDSIVISNGDITSPGGIIDFKLPESVSNFNNITTPNFVVIDAVSPLTFFTRELTGSTNIIVSQGDGQNGDPIFKLNSNLSELSSINVGNLTLSGDSISNNNKNGNIELNTNGTGDIILNGVAITPGGSISGITNIKAFAIFTDTLSGDTNIIVNENNINMTTIEGGGGTYTCKFNAPMSHINYGVTITLGSTGGELPFISNGYFIVRDLEFVTIIVTDASGELVRSVPHGVTVTVIST